MTTFTIPDKSAVTTVDPDADVFPIWQSDAQHKATARQIAKAMVCPTAQPSGATITVKTSGGDFTSITAAIAHAEETYVSPQNGNGNIGVPSFVDIVISDGTWALPNALSGGRNCYLRIKGENAYDKTMSSVVSSSGSAGAWSIVIALNNVTNIAVDDYVLIHAPSGGTKPTHIAGCWHVTNVDTGNSRITITSTHKHATPPSGNVTATVRVIKTILTVTGSGAEGIRIWDQSYVVLNDLVFVGSAGVAAGIDVQDGSRVYLGSIGVTGFNMGLYLLYCSEINSDYPLCLSNNTYGAYVDAHSCCYSTQFVVSGNTTGMYAFHNSTIGANAGIVSGNTSGITVETMATADIGNGSVTGNVNGTVTYKCGYVYDGSTTFADNGTNWGSRFNVDGTLNTVNLTASGGIRFSPGSSFAPYSNGMVSFEATNNTTFTIKYQGSDGTIRSGTITLA